jgi:acyl-CoA thioesterase-1
MLKLIKQFWFASILSLSCISCQQGTENEDKQASNGQTQKPVTTAENNQKETTKTLLFFGNSLTAGYGLDPSQAFPALIQERIDSLHLPYKVINSGLSGETTAGGKSRIGWVLREKVDVFILELGGNDGLRGIDVESTRQNLQAIIDTVKAKNPETRIVLAGMQIPPNMGTEYTARFRGIFAELAEKNNTGLIPFLLENVGGIPSLNLPDGIHPTAEGHKIVAENVWRVLQPVLTDNM